MRQKYGTTQTGSLRWMDQVPLTAKDIVTSEGGGQDRWVTEGVSGETQQSAAHRHHKTSVSPEQTRHHEPVVLIDSHVHIHAHTDVAVLLASAVRNFSGVAARHHLASWTGMLWLAEMAGQNWFDTVAQRRQMCHFGSWQVTVVGPNTLFAASTGERGSLYIVAGSQVVSAERIEVLALGTRARFDEGQPLDHTIRAAHGAGALVVLPWGVGKWLGQRGQLVHSALTLSRENRILAGDNSGRPAFWAEPDVFRAVRSCGRPVLPGTDPLPVPGEERRVGANGFWLHGKLPEQVDGTALRKMVLEAGTDGVHPFGRRETPWRFIRNQLALRTRKQ